MNFITVIPEIIKGILYTLYSYKIMWNMNSLNNLFFVLTEYNECYKSREIPYKKIIIIFYLVIYYYF